MSKDNKTNQNNKNTNPDNGIVAEKNTQENVSEPVVKKRKQKTEDEEALHTASKDHKISFSANEETIESLLVEGERIVKEARIHWAIFMTGVFWCLIAILVAVFFHPWVGLAIILVMASYPLVNALILFYTTRLVVTNKRVFSRYGFFNRDLIQIRMDRLETAQLEQPFFGQLLGYATVMISGTGTGMIALPFIANGRVLVKGLQEFLITGKETKDDIK